MGEVFSSKITILPMDFVFFFFFFRCFLRFLEFFFFTPHVSEVFLVSTAGEVFFFQKTSVPTPWISNGAPPLTKWLFSN